MKFIPVKNSVSNLRDYRFDILLLLSFLIFYLASIAFVNLDPHAKDWDAAIYISWVRDFPNILNNHINSYHLQKIFPSVCVNIIMRVFNLSLDSDTILSVFQYFNAGVKLVGLFFLLRIFDFFKMTNKVKIIGVLILSINSTLFLWVNTPASIDPTAFTLFLIILWSYFKNKNWLLITLILPSAFCWPSLIYMIIVFFLFPIKFGKKEQSQSDLRINESLLKSIKLYTPILSTAISLFFILFQLYNDNYIKWCYPADFSDYTPITAGLIPLSVLSLVGLIYLGTKAIVTHLNNHFFQAIIVIFKSKNLWLRLLLIVLCLISVRYLINSFSSSEIPVVSTKRILSSTFILPLIYPLSTILAHLIWYGPVVLVIIFNLKTIYRYIFENSLHALVILTPMLFLFSINIESRYSINYFVILFVLFLIAIQKNKKVQEFALYSQVIFYGIIHLLKDHTYESVYQLNGPWISYFNYTFSLVLLIIFSILYFKINNIRIQKNG